MVAAVLYKIHSIELVSHMRIRIANARIDSTRQRDVKTREQLCRKTFPNNAHKYELFAWRLSTFSMPFIACCPLLFGGAHFSVSVALGAAAAPTTSPHMHMLGMRLSGQEVLSLVNLRRFYFVALSLFFSSFLLLSRNVSRVSVISPKRNFVVYLLSWQTWGQWVHFESWVP